MYYDVFLLALCVAVRIASTMDNLNEAYEWKKLDFEYTSEEARRAAIDSGAFNESNNLPFGLEVYGDRIFITVPRWKKGVAASLAYIKLSDRRFEPKLRPYPNWEAHNLRSNDSPQIVSPFRIRADQCGRLWVLDTGAVNLLGNVTVLAPVRLLIYDLHNDQLLRTFEIPAKQIKQRSFFTNIAVEDNDCQDTYAYLADVGHPSLVVYSWKKHSSWMITHNFFHMDPLAGELNVAGLMIQWADGVYGLALSGPNSDSFSTLYFHPFNSFNEFAVSTEVLRNESASMTEFDQFKILGSRGPKSQSGVEFLDKKTNVLFYSLVNLNAVACWRTTNRAYTMESQGRIFMSNITMVFPNDIKVDGNDNLWVLSNRLPLFMYTHLDSNEINFRILTAKVNDAIRDTACDTNFVVSPTIVEKIMPVLNITLTKTNSSTKVSSATSIHIEITVIVLTAILGFIRNLIGFY